MDWEKLGEEVLGFGLPILGMAIGGPGGAAIGKIAASAMGLGGDDPVEISAALANDPAALIALKTLELENGREIRAMDLAARTAQIVQTQTTMRKEADSDDAYVRRARPTFLYITAGSIAVEVLIALIVVSFRPTAMIDLVSLYEALAVPQSIALAACGIYLKKRSDDKQTAAGVSPAGGLLKSILNRGAG